MYSYFLHAISTQFTFLSSLISLLMVDLKTSINFTYPQNAALDDNCRRFEHVTWLDSGKDMYLRPESVVVHDLTPKLEELYDTTADRQMDERGFAVVHSQPQTSLNPLDEQRCADEVRE